MNPSVFNGYINQIPVDLGLMTAEAQTRALEVQARCVALANRGTPCTAAQANDDAWWQQQHIEQTAYDTAHAQVMSGQGIVSPAVPSSGQIAAAIGAIDADTKNALLVAQASQRALGTIDLVFDASKDHKHNPALFAHISDKDPTQLRFAQEANRIASQVAEEIRNPDFKKAAPEVQEATFAEYTHVVAELKSQALAAYHSSAVMLGVRAAELAKANDPRATRTAEVADEINTLVVSLGGKAVEASELATYAAQRNQAGNTDIAPPQAEQSQSNAGQGSFADRVTGSRANTNPQQLG